MAGLSSSQLEVRKQVENYLQDKAQSMLDGVLGPDKAIVRLSATLDFQQLERTSETFDPNSPSIRSEERTKTSSTSSDKAEETSESNQDENTETVITNYELNRTMEHIVNAVGTIERLSVAVLIDGLYNEMENEAGTIERIYQPRSQEELDRLSAIVKSAVGFDMQRNDQIDIVNIPFDRHEMDDDREALDSIYQRDFYMEVARKVGLVLLIIVAFLYLRKRARRLFRVLAGFLPPPPPPPPPPEPVRVEKPKEPEEEPVIIEPEKRRPRLVEQMQEQAKDRPEELARVIKTLMVD
jgi:flagellar M-ring protein FliF